MNERLNEFLWATSLRRNMQKEYTLLSSDGTLLDPTYLDNLRLAALDLKNFYHAINTWSELHDFAFLNESVATFSQEKLEFLDQLSDCLAGKFEVQVLEEVLDKHYESILLDKGTPFKYITITLRMVETTINQNSSSLRSSLGVDGTCNLLCVSHQESFIAYLRASLEKAISTCTQFEEALNSNYDLHDRSLAVAEMMKTLEEQIKSLQ